MSDLIVARGNTKRRQPLQTAKFLIRDITGMRLHEVEGWPVKIDILPDWQFFIRRYEGRSWLLTEVRSGAKFPPSLEDTFDAALWQFNNFCRRQGKEECERVFQKVIDQWGDLRRPN